MSGNNKYFISKVIDSIQFLEEISGPDTIEEYIAILVAVRAEIDKRIGDAIKDIN